MRDRHMGIFSMNKRNNMVVDTYLQVVTLIVYFWCLFFLFGLLVQCEYVNGFFCFVLFLFFMATPAAFEIS